MSADGSAREVVSKTIVGIDLRLSEKISESIIVVLRITIELELIAIDMKIISSGLTRRFIKGNLGKFNGFSLVIVSFIVMVR